MTPALKQSLEELLRARRLQAEAPPLRGEDRRLQPLAFGVAALDGLIAGGLPRGALSEIHGPASSGRTGLALALCARATGRGALVAWMDPADRFDPASAAEAGMDLARLLWLRGGKRVSLPSALSALGTVLGSGLFEAVVLDLASVAVDELRRLPNTSFIRLQRMIEDSPTALLVVAGSHVACGPGGVSLALTPARAEWSGAPGPGRLLRGLAGEARAGRHVTRPASFRLDAV
jgi:recombination protein RecA